MARKPDPGLYLLGKYLGLVFLLPSAAFAGYLLGSFVEHYLHWSIAKPAGIVLGVIAGLVKLFQELLRDAEAGNRQSR